MKSIKLKRQSKEAWEAAMSNVQIQEKQLQIEAIPALDSVVVQY